MSNTTATGLGELNINEFDSNPKLPIVKNMQIIDIIDIDPNPYNPRKSVNESIEEMKDSIRAIGLLQTFSVAKHQKSNRWTIVQGGNTRLKALTELWQETGDSKYLSIQCVIEEFDFIKDKTISIIRHLVENDVRGEMILVDKAISILEIEQELMSAGGADINNPSKSNPATQILLKTLRENGYDIKESRLSTFRFTVNILVGGLDYHLHKGLGAEPINQIRKLYNNAKRIYKENTQDYQEYMFDDLFKQSIQSYTGKKAFNFERLLNAIASYLISFDEFKDYGNEFNTTLLVRKLLEGKKEREAKLKEQEKAQENNNKKHDDNNVPPTNLNVEPKQTHNTSLPSSNDPQNNNLDDVEHHDQEEHIQTPENLTNDKQELLGIRQKSQQLVTQIEQHYDIKIVDYVDIGCGFLVVKKPITTNQYQHIFVFWYLLSMSLVIDQNSVDYQTIESFRLDIDKDLLDVYKVVNSNYKHALNKLEILDFGTQYKPYPYLINIFKNNLDPKIWQLFTELEFCQYQISSLSKQGVDIWL